MIPHVLHAHLVLVKVAQQGFIQCHALVFQRRPVARQLLAAGVVLAVIQIQDALAPGVQQVLGRLHGGALIVAQHAVHSFAGEGTVQQDQRHALGSLADVVVILIVVLDKGRTHQHHAVHMAGLQQLHASGAGLQGLAGAAQHAVVIPAAEGVFQVCQRLGLIRVRGIGTQKANGLHGVQAQPSCKGIGNIPAVVDHRHDPLAGRRADVGAVVQHTAHRGNGNARPLGDIVYIHVVAPSAIV